jgi:hypothetical protein
MVVVAVLLLPSTVTRGLWIEYSGQEVGQSNFASHVIVGILAMTATVIAVMLSVEEIIAVG